MRCICHKVEKILLCLLESSTHTNIICAAEAPLWPKKKRKLLSHQLGTRREVPSSRWRQARLRLWITPHGLSRTATNSQKGDLLAAYYSIILVSTNTGHVQNSYLLQYSMWYLRPKCHFLKKELVLTNIICFSICFRSHFRMSLVVQWLRPQASTAVHTGSVPSWGTKIPHAAWHSQKKSHFTEVNCKISQLFNKWNWNLS